MRWNLFKIKEEIDALQSQYNALINPLTNSERSEWILSEIKRLKEEANFLIQFSSLLVAIAAAIVAIIAASIPIILGMFQIANDRTKLVAEIRPYIVVENSVVDRVGNNLSLVITNKGNSPAKILKRNFECVKPITNEPFGNEFSSRTFVLAKDQSFVFTRPIGSPLPKSYFTCEFNVVYSGVYPDFLLNKSFNAQYKLVETSSDAKSSFGYEEIKMD
jgi:hypothetical protein